MSGLIPLVCRKNRDRGSVWGTSDSYFRGWFAGEMIARNEDSAQNRILCLTHVSAIVRYIKKINAKGILAPFPLRRLVYLHWTYRHKPRQDFYTE